MKRSLILIPLVFLLQGCDQFGEEVRLKFKSEADLQSSLVKALPASQPCENLNGYLELERIEYKNNTSYYSDITTQKITRYSSLCEKKESADAIAAARAIEAEKQAVIDKRIFEEKRKLEILEKTQKTYYCEFKDSDHIDSTIVVVNQNNELAKFINPITNFESVASKRFYKGYDPVRKMVIGSIPANDNKGCNEIFGRLSEDARIKLNIRKLKADPNTAKLIKKSYITKFVIHNLKNNSQCAEVTYLLTKPFRLVCTDSSDNTRWIEFTKKEAKSLKTVKLRSPISEKRAKQLCRAETKSRLFNPKTFAYQDSQTNTVETTGITAVVIHFSASNALGETTNFRMACHYSGDEKATFNLTKVSED
jgi:hypothetical protein